MAEPFKAKVKPRDGKIYPCVICGVVPKEGDDLIMQNIAKEGEPASWLVSPHEECFKKLQADPSLKNKKQAGGNRQSKTPEQIVSYRIAMSEQAWKYAKEKAEKETPIEKREILGITELEYKSYLANRLRDRSILSSVFYYGIMKGGN